MRRHRPRREQGFVLIGAVWLLLLSTALVAILMLMARNTAQAAVRDGQELQRTLDAEAATETVAAEFLIDGPRSPWWGLPATGTITLSGRAIEVRLTSEAGRLDLNDGDLGVIASALQGLRYPAAVRQRFLGALVVSRGRGRIAATAEVDQLTAMLAAPPAAGCPTSWFTLESGLMTPQLDRADPLLVRALGAPALGDPAQPHPGEALRATMNGPGGSGETMVFRTGGAGAIAGISRRWIGSC